MSKPSLLRGRAFQLTNLRLELDNASLIRSRRAGRMPVIDLLLLESATQRLGMHIEQLGNLDEPAVVTLAFATPLNDKPTRSLLQLR